MSALLDKARALVARALEKHGADATITRTTVARTAADRAAGRAGTPTTVTLTGKGILGNRRRYLADGTINQQAVATLDIVTAQKGDTLTIGLRSFEIVETELTDPHGGVPIVITAVIK